MMCEISQIALTQPVWEIPHMARVSNQQRISPTLVKALERIRPIDETGKPWSDKRWCEEAAVSPGFWRDLRKGTEPGIDKVDRLARAAGVTLSELLEGVEPPANPLPSEDEIAGFLAEAQRELPIGTTLADYPRVVGPALRLRLARYANARRGKPYPEPVNAPDRDAQPQTPTMTSAQE